MLNLAKMKSIYLDYAATTPTHELVVAEMQPYHACVFGNPSSLHHFGRDGKRALDLARDQLAALLNADPEEIVFTGSGTEADNFALKGVAYAQAERGRHIITSKIEHHAILESAAFLESQGWRVTYLNVDTNGVVDLDELQKALTPETVLVSIMHANNEIGTIQPVEKIAEIIRQFNLRQRSEKNSGVAASPVYFHTDAVQTAGILGVDVKKMRVDLLSVSAHKFYGPKGVGALYINKGTRISSFMHGGGQERGRRASTENVAGIAGFGKAAEIAQKERKGWAEHAAKLRDKLTEGILKTIPDSILNGHPTERLPGNVNVSIKYVEGEAMLLNLDMQGIACSTGSACSSGSLEPSHILLAIGRTHADAHSSLRFSLGRHTTEEDIDFVLEVLPKIVSRLRAMSPLYKK
ncbi:MAG: cysteine desulfurase NifS [Candidatus Margulisiibacteriota bacterium]